MPQTTTERTNVTEYLPKRRGRPRLNGTAEVDYRTVLSLLPGKLLVRRWIDRELAQIRSGVKAGGNREWLALLPGLEMEQKQLTMSLEAMAGVLGGEFGLGEQHRDEGEDEGEGGGEGDGEGQQVEAVSHQIEAPADGKGVEIASVLRQAHKNGKPTTAAVLLSELMAAKKVNRKEFIERWAGEYPTLNNTAGLSTALARLREAGVRFDTPRGHIVLRSRMAGAFPASIAGHPFINRSAPPKIAAPVPQPAKPAKNGRFEGTQNQILIEEMCQAPDKTVNVPELERKYGTKHMTFHYAMGSLKRHFGFRFRRVGAGTFQLLKEGRMPTPKQGKGE